MGSKLSRIQEALDFTRKTQHPIQARRLEKAADVANLDRYSTDALIQAFLDQNAGLYTTIKPGTFERYAKELPQQYLDANPYGRFRSIEKKHWPADPTLDGYLDLIAKGAEDSGPKSGWSDMPTLWLNRGMSGPEVGGHEGRHRARLLAREGEENTLVNLLPANAGEQYPPPDERLGYMLGKYFPQGNKTTFTPEAQGYPRPPVKFPEEVFAEGGPLRMAGGGKVREMTQRLLDAASKRGHPIPFRSTEEWLEESPIMNMMPRLSRHYADSFDDYDTINKVVRDHYSLPRHELPPDQNRALGNYVGSGHSSMSGVERLRNSFVPQRSAQIRREFPDIDNYREMTDSLKAFTNNELVLPGDIFRGGNIRNTPLEHDPFTIGGAGFGSFSLSPAVASGLSRVPSDTTAPYMARIAEDVAGLKGREVGHHNLQEMEVLLHPRQAFDPRKIAYDAARGTMLFDLERSNRPYSPHAVMGWNEGGPVDLPPVEMSSKGSVRKGILSTIERLVEGKPKEVKLPGGETMPSYPIRELEDIAGKFAAKHGNQYPIESFPRFDEDRARKIAQAYEDMRHDPNSPEVKRSYQALIDETMDQYNALKPLGLNFEFLKPGEGNPYKTSPSLVYKDLLENNRMKVFPTEGGFGTLNQISTNPLETTRVGQIGDLPNATANDAFRVVHDIYGHVGPGNPYFRAAGEDRAWRAHGRAYSPDALPAATSELRGQNSWVNYGPNAKANRGASQDDTIYADQKVNLLPPWVWDDVGKAEGGPVHMDKGGILKRLARALTPQEQARRAEEYIAKRAESSKHLDPDERYQSIIREPNKLVYPGIYQDPARIAQEAADLVARKAPDQGRESNLFKVFGVQRQDLPDIARDTRQGLVPPMTAPLRASGSAVTEQIMTPRNKQHYMDVASEALQHESLVPSKSWYEMSPVWDAGRMAGADEHDLKRLNTVMGMFSPNAEVSSEIARGIPAYYYLKQGRADDFAKHVGTVPHLRDDSYLREMQSIPGHVRHSAHTAPYLRYAETGNPGYNKDTVKVPHYIAATDPLSPFSNHFVADAHNARGLGYPDVRKMKTPQDVVANLSSSEFWDALPHMQKMARELDMTPTELQALNWNAFGPQTEVARIGVPKAEMIADHIARRAADTGRPLEEMRDMILRGEAHAEGGLIEDSGLPQAFDWHPTPAMGGSDEPEADKRWAEMVRRHELPGMPAAASGGGGGGGGGGDMSALIGTAMKFLPLLLDEGGPVPRIDPDDEGRLSYSPFERQQRRLAVQGERQTSPIESFGDYLAGGLRHEGQRFTDNAKYNPALYAADFVGRHGETMAELFNPDMGLRHEYGPSLAPADLVGMLTGSGAVSKAAGRAWRARPRFDDGGPVGAPAAWNGQMTPQAAQQPPVPSQGVPGAWNGQMAPQAAQPESSSPWRGTVVGGPLSQSAGPLSSEAVQPPLPTSAPGVTPGGAIQPPMPGGAPQPQGEAIQPPIPGGAPPPQQSQGQTPDWGAMISQFFAMMNQGGGQQNSWGGYGDLGGQGNGGPGWGYQSMGNGLYPAPRINRTYGNTSKGHAAAESAAGQQSSWGGYGGYPMGGQAPTSGVWGGSPWGYAEGGSVSDDELLYHPTMTQDWACGGMLRNSGRAR